MTDDTRALAARLIAASPLAMSLEEALKQKRERRAALLAPTPGRTSPPEPDFKPAPLPVVDAPAAFANDFWSKRAPKLPDPPKPKPKPKKPQPGRKPVGNLPAGADRFTVIDGEGGDKPPKE